MGKTPEDFITAHDALPDDAHVCPDYNLSPEECYRATACAECGIRRDEHADQPEQSSFPKLDITEHAFIEHIQLKGVN